MHVTTVWRHDEEVRIYFGIEIIPDIFLFTRKQLKK